MEKLNEIAKALKLKPRLSLGVKIAGAGMKTTGPHTVTFTEEPIVVVGKDFEGKERKELKFIIKEDGEQKRWNVPILNKLGEPNYLLERLLDVKVGDIRILEMMRRGPRNYIDVRKVDEEPQEPPLEDDEDGHGEE